MSKIYNLKSVEELMNRYVDEYNGEVATVKEGVLGYGTTLLHSAEGRKSIVIQEVYLNAWSSGHTIRMYKTLPKKYEKYTY
jgi:hypothetical protein